jgi:hypothetical protein
MATPTNLPASFSTAQILTAGQMNDMRGAFRILQVVSGSTSTIVSNSTTTLADTGLTATITPQSNTSKILVVVSQTYGKNAGNASNAVISVIKRGATTVSTFQGAALYTGTTLDFVGPAASAVLLDSPATTSATTYKTQFCNFTGAASVSANTNNALATITLFEVSA